MTDPRWFSSLFTELRLRNSHAHLSLLSPASLALRQWLEEQLGDLPGQPNSLLSTPVFEHKFGFRTVDASMNDLVQSGLLSDTLVTSMATPQEPYQEQAFPRDRHPFTHQLDSWTALKREQPTSVVVSAGTGAGKTECFLVPILDDLVRQSQAQQRRLEGVQALFLYPLNALINSQRERLTAWTQGLGGQVRYCLYNGETKRTVAAAEQRQHPEQVLSRKALRNSPPPLLITNATMLEYMLVRPEDTPILEKSKGKLKYIVIDEAHTYVGSMAAELALLLRRVMNAFDVDPREVRFIATSATLSSDDGEGSRREIRQFLADIAGQPCAQIEVYTDQRSIPDLPDTPSVGGWPEAADLLATSTAERFPLLCGYAGPRLLRSTLVERGAQTVRALAVVCEDAGLPLSEEQIVEQLDLCKTAALPAQEPFLPLRGHIFARGLEGLWACLDPHCAGRSNTPLDAPSWPFGAVYSHRRSHCQHPDCSAPVFEITLCRQCGHVFLSSEIGEDEEGFEVLQHLPISPDEPLPAHARLIGAPLPEAAPTDQLEPTVSIDPRSGAIEPDEQGQPFAILRAPSEGTTRCPCCGHADSPERPFVRTARSGRDFLLGVSVPVLLQFMRPEPGSNKLPLDGRRTISFTDSRQGTARFAARSQGESERNYVRSFIYHTVLAHQRRDESKISALQKQLNELRLAQKQAPDPSLLEHSLNRCSADLEAAQAPKSVTLKDVAQCLAKSPSFHSMHRYWMDYLPFKQSHIDTTILAEWLVLGEFARRPKRRASLETLGLISVHFPRINRNLPIPHLWKSWAGEEAEESWGHLLKLLVDFFIRSNSAIELPKDFFRWVGTEIRPKLVTGPGGATLRNQRVSWPRLKKGSRPRLAWLVMRALRLSPDDPDTRERVNDVLDAAWECIKPALRVTEGGYALVMDEVELLPVQTAWMCPITRTLLDTTLLGHSPYQPSAKHPFNTLCAPVQMPRVPTPFWNDAGTAEAWLATDPLVRAARERGALPEYGERVLAFSRYYQVAEHSAQIPSSVLKRAEEQFREGKLNLLSCSTTMEMGVDIGNLSGVAMNNAPPSPANFLQRVGRAGRRGENAAVSLTICRQLPHDLAVFAEPDWAFRTPMHITPVKLDSQPIVERHIRALALTRFFQSQIEKKNLLRMNCRWFFQPPADRDTSVCDHLIDWLGKEAHQDEVLDHHLQRLVKATVLDGLDSPTFLNDSVPAFDQARERFSTLRGNIIASIEELPEEEHQESPAWWALHRQQRRLDEEYLLRLLADEQVLPGYGFPSGVLPLVTTTIEELKALKARAARHIEDDERTDRIDVRARLMGFPSRDLPIAIREYAPGGNVVLDRRTYHPRGVTLNWHLPPNADENSVKAVQALRFAWRCDSCGATGTSPLMSPSLCPSCDGVQVDSKRYLQPAGFAVDLFDNAQMNALPPVHIPMQFPWISSGNGPFNSLGSPPLVRFRHTPSGEIIHLNAGEHRHGYALCLRCGRAEPESSRGAHRAELPKGMQNHLRLRGGKGSKWNQEGTNPRCEGNENSWSIRRNLHLGGSTRTDVLELQILNSEGGQLRSDETLLTTTAVALRKEAARMLGIDERELGYQLSPRLIDGQRGFAILLYDTASGGAGFCANLPPLLPELFRRAVTTCECPRDCDQACHACLLSNDTQHDLEHLDRFALLPKDNGEPAVFDDAFLDGLDLPEDLRAFGASTQVLWGDPHRSFLRHVRRLVGGEGPVEVQLHVHGEAKSWDPVGWSGRSLIRSLHALGEVEVRVVVPNTGLDALDWQQRRQLLGFEDNEGITFWRRGQQPSIYPLRIWAEVQTEGRCTAFASDGPQGFDAPWANRRPSSSTHLSGQVPALTPLEGQLSIDPSSLSPRAAVTEINLSSTANGRARDFGERFWKALLSATPGLQEELAKAGFADKIVYQDRYLKSPLSVHSLYRVLLYLKEHGTLGPQTQVEVWALQTNSSKSPARIEHDWVRWEAQQQVIEGLLGSLGVRPMVHLISPRDRQRTQHHRSLEVAWGPDEIELRLDAGFGYVAPMASVRFPFGGSVDAQVTMLRNGSWGTRPQWGKTAVPAYLLR